MDKFISKEKMSKKAKKKIAAEQRGTWAFSPITKKIDSKKLYNRKRISRARYDEGTRVFCLRDYETLSIVSLDIQPSWLIPSHLYCGIENKSYQRPAGRNFKIFFSGFMCISQYGQLPCPKGRIVHNRVPKGGFILSNDCTVKRYIVCLFEPTLGQGLTAAPDSCRVHNR